MIELGPVWRTCVPVAFLGRAGADFCAFVAGRGRELGAEVSVAWGRPPFGRETRSVVVQGQTVEISLIN